jgi:hypothetical protein
VQVGDGGRRATAQRGGATAVAVAPTVAGGCCTPAVEPDLTADAARVP